MEKNNLLSNLSIDEISKKNYLFWDYLSKNAYPLTKGEIRLPISMEPFEISKIKFDFIQEDIKNVISSGKKIVSNYFEDAQIRDHLKLCSKEEELFNLSKDQDFLGVVRCDIFYSDSDTIKLIEMNTDFPDGFFMHDVTTEALLFNLDRKIHSRFSHSEQFEQLLLKISPDKSKNIFVGYDRDRFFKDEFELSKLELNKLGFSNVFVGPIEDLELVDDYFSYQGNKIDVLRRGTEISKFKENVEFMNKLKIVLEENTTQIVNNFKMRLLGHKNLLSLLTNPQFHHYFTGSEISSISKLVPKTVSLIDVDYSEFLRVNSKDAWVLKASDLAEGENVYLGCDTEQNEWENLVIKASNEPIHWILQEKVKIPETEFSLFNEESGLIEKSLKKFDFNPHVILCGDNVEFGNILVRFSEESILNVMKGGGITYCLIKDE